MRATLTSLTSGAPSNRLTTVRGPSRTQDGGTCACFWPTTLLAPNWRFPHAQIGTEAVGIDKLKPQSRHYLAYSGKNLPWLTHDFLAAIRLLSLQRGRFKKRKMDLKTGSYANDVQRRTFAISCQQTIGVMGIFCFSRGGQRSVGPVGGPSCLPLPAALVVLRPPSSSRKQQLSRLVVWNADGREVADSFLVNIFPSIAQNTETRQASASRQRFFFNFTEKFADS